MRRTIPAILAFLFLVSCGKPSPSDTRDQCIAAKGGAGIETDAQAQQACRDNKKFLGPDAKPAKIKIENH